MLHSDGPSSVKTIEDSDGEEDSVQSSNKPQLDGESMVDVDGQNSDFILRQYDRLVLGIDPNSALRKTKFVLMGEMSDYLISEILDDADYLLVCDSKSTEANRRRAEAWKALLNKFERKYPGCNITPDMARRHFHYHRKRIQALVQTFEENQKRSDEPIEDPRSKFTATETAVYNYMLTSGSEPTPSGRFKACRTKSDSFSAAASDVMQEQLAAITEAATTSALTDDFMDGRERQPTMTPAFTLRLLEEVRKSRGILKCANNRGESRRKKRIEWQRISDELNAQFGTAYTVMQIYKKVENVKGKVKQKLEAMKSVRDDRVATLENFTVPEQFFMENMMEGMDFEVSSQMDDDGDDEQSHDLLSQINVGRRLDFSDLSLAQLKMENDETFLPGNLMGAASTSDFSPTTSSKRAFSNPSITETGLVIDPLGDHIRTKKARLSPDDSPSNGSPVPLNLLLPMVTSEQAKTTISQIPQTSAKNFKEKLVNCLSQIPNEKMREIHRIVKHEIDTAYAQQVADEILNRFDEGHREGVMNRILEVLKNN